MDNFSFEDLLLESSKDVEVVQWDGKLVHARPLSFSTARQLSSQFAGRENEEAEDDDIIRMAAAMLCNPDGTPFNSDVNVTVKALGNMDYNKVLSLWAALQVVGGLSIDAEKKD
jgi:hypothetical protein